MNTDPQVPPAGPERPFDDAVTSRSTRAPRLPRLRDPGDAWVEGPDGTRYWGRFGAAGLLVVDPERGVLLQHRASWSHHGDTWGVPGGALHEGEAPVVGACREAAEEAGVPAEALVPLVSVVADRGVWRYTTIVAAAREAFEARAMDAESHELRWVPVAQVEHLPLHPGFGSAWPVLAETLGWRPVHVVVDVANLMGSVPDGWWRDRRGSAAQWLDRLVRWDPRSVQHEGTPKDPPVDHPAVSGDHGLAVEVLTHVTAVVEGAARGARASAAAPHLTVVDARESGDDAIVTIVRRLESSASVIVVTADRELRERVAEAGGDVRGVTWLRDSLPE